VEAARRQRRLGMESLEQRELMAVSVINGDLHIEGTGIADRATVEIVGPIYLRPFSSYKVTENGQSRLFSFGGIDTEL